MTVRKTLDQIGLDQGTDKSSSHHDYLRFYELFLSGLRDEEFTLIELGINKGGSLRTWEEYFPAARVVGIDVKPKWVDQDFDRAETLLGDCGNAPFLSDLTKRLHPSVIIDDASHFWSHQITAFEANFEHLHSGAYFIMEDLNTSFDGLRREPFNDRIQDAFMYFSQLNTLNCGQNWSHPYHQVMPPTKRQRELSRLIDFMAFFPATLIIKKA